MYTSIVYDEEGSKPLILDDSILSVWGNTNNSIRPVLLDLNQDNDDMEQPQKNGRTAPYPGVGFTSIAELPLALVMIEPPTL